MARRGASPPGGSSSRHAAAVVQAELEARSALRELERTEAKAACLEHELEDTRVAILGYQVDLEREGKILHALEADVGFLGDRFLPHAESQDALAEASERLSEELCSAEAQEPILKRVVASLRQKLGGMVEASGLSPSRRPLSPTAGAFDSAAAADLREVVRSAEVACEEEESRERELRQDEGRLEVTHRALQFELEAAQRRLTVQATEQQQHQRVRDQEQQVQAQAQRQHLYQQQQEHQQQQQQQPQQPPPLPVYLQTQLPRPTGVAGSMLRGPAA
mmetsp:Transcript_88035/g.282533  ORF Transcript_88035/g.282533 Transcript_88035/m.282533 type:complete len:277 (-) Transcript_88035:30-860(-)